MVQNSKGKIRMPQSKTLANLLNCNDPDFVDFIDKCVEWKTDQRLTPEAAFSHPFISKAVNELKCLRQTGSGSVAAERSEGLSSPPSAPEAAISTEGK